VEVEADACGGAVLRMLGDQASWSDVYTIAEGILVDPGFRERCNLLSCLVNEEPILQRQELCRHVVTVLLSNFNPEGPSEGSFLPTTAVFAKQCTPPPHSHWSDHVQARYRMVRATKRGSLMVPEAEFAALSPYLFDRVAAIESLWGVRGHLLSK